MVWSCGMWIDYDAAVADSAAELAARASGTGAPVGGSGQTLAAAEKRPGAQRAAAVLGYTEQQGQR